jgi:hypothetical protein
MSWYDKIKELGGGDFTFLSSDGEVIVFVIVDDPVIIASKFKGKEQTRVGCPVVTDEGFVLFVTGTRVARKLSKFESRFKDTAFMVVRHGGENDVNAKYDVRPLDDTAKTKQLLGMVKAEYSKEKLAAAIKDVKKVMKE